MMNTIIYHVDGRQCSVSENYYTNPEAAQAHAESFAKKLGVPVVDYTLWNMGADAEMAVKARSPHVMVESMCVSESFQEE